jgi:three-Cys-motif partner protein
MAKDRWRELCKLVEKDDGLPVRDVGPWTEEKLFFWNRYIEITTTAMVGHPKWPAGLVYVDLFAGPGVCRIEETGKRIPGSPLIAANSPKPFARILACERDSNRAAACRRRLAQEGSRTECHVIEGDCNEQVHKLVGMIPAGALTLAFIDPTGLHARFVTIETLSKHGPVDLLLLFADAYDIVRNVDLYFKDPDSNLDQVLGPDSNWRERWEQMGDRSSTSIRRMFAGLYREQLARYLGYRVFREKTMKSTHGALYRLIYASKHELAAR